MIKTVHCHSDLKTDIHKESGLILYNLLCVCSRVDNLYAFFVQWSPDVYGKEAREQGFVVVEKDELDMIDNFFSDPASCSWEVSSVEKAGSTLASFYLHPRMKTIRMCWLTSLIQS